MHLKEIYGKPKIVFLKKGCHPTSKSGFPLLYSITLPLCCFPLASVLCISLSICGNWFETYLVLFYLNLFLLNTVVLGEIFSVKILLVTKCIHISCYQDMNNLSGHSFSKYECPPCGNHCFEYRGFCSE